MLSASLNTESSLFRGRKDFGNSNHYPNMFRNTSPSRKS